VRRALQRVSRSRPLARALLGIDFPAIRDGERYFDLTTPVLIRTVARDLTPASRVLDMGTGLFAAIGLALWRRVGCSVVCSDVDERIVARALQAVALNHAPLEVVQSDLFERAPGPFDAVTFNPPYVPREQLLGNETFASQSDGGPGGTAVLERFLDAFAEHGGGAVAYVGLGATHVPRSRVTPLVAARPALELRDIRGSRLPPVDVYVLARR
jgi:hypothetical protein